MTTAIDILINAALQPARFFQTVSNDIDKMGESASRASEQLGAIGQRMTRTGGILSAGLTAPLTAFGAIAINSASDVEESISKVGVVFGDNAADIEAWSSTASEAFGLSQQQALEAAGTFGNLFGSMGIEADATEDMSTGLVQLAADLASFNNIDPTESLEKLRAGIVGETEPLRTLGVNLSAATVEIQALEMGLAATASELTEQDKVTARYALIMEQTAAAQGDFARTSDGLANSQRILKAQTADIGAELGAVLLPIALELAQKLIVLVEKFQELSPEMRRIIVLVAGAAAVFGPLLVALGTAVSVVSTLWPLISTLAGVVSVLASPVVIVAAVIGGLLAVLFDWGGANEKVAQTLEDWGLEGVANGVRNLHEWVDSVVESAKSLLSGEMTFEEFFGVSIPEWIETLFEWTWPALEPVEWATRLMAWGWPRFPGAPSWLEDLLDWKWPSLPNINLPGFGRGNATGTSFFHGGATLVGETGPELAILPRGTEIYPAAQTRQMVGAGAGTINVNVNANVSNQIDVYEMAYNVADILRRKGLI